MKEDIKRNHRYAREYINTGIPMESMRQPMGDDMKKYTTQDPTHQKHYEDAIQRQKENKKKEEIEHVQEFDKIIEETYNERIAEIKAKAKTESGIYLDDMLLLFTNKRLKSLDQRLAKLEKYTQE